MATTLDDLHLTINISGLPFINNTYDYSNYSTGGNIGNSAAANIASIKIANNDTAATEYSNPKILTFYKSQMNADIKIDLLRVSDNLFPVLSQKLPTLIFYLDIYGVELAENSRMKY